jgi:hypothetical protein
MEGAKGIESAATRHVARLLRHAPAQPRPQPPAAAKGRSQGAGTGGGAGGPVAALLLSVAEGGRELKAAVVPRRQQQGEEAPPIRGRTRA